MALRHLLSFFCLPRPLEQDSRPTNSRPTPSTDPPSPSPRCGPRVCMCPCMCLSWRATPLRQALEAAPFPWPVCAWRWPLVCSSDGVCVCVCVCVCVGGWVGVRVYACMHACVFACMCVRLCVRARPPACACACACAQIRRKHASQKPQVAEAQTKLAHAHPPTLPPPTHHRHVTPTPCR